ncbi:MAG: hypothetical protein V1870_01570 [Candidatus Aenigmatarchaeota archaeon]
MSINARAESICGAYELERMRQLYGPEVVKKIYETLNSPIGYEK